MTQHGTSVTSRHTWLRLQQDLVRGTWCWVLTPTESQPWGNPFVDFRSWFTRYGGGWCRRYPPMGAPIRRNIFLPTVQSDVQCNPDRGFRRTISTIQVIGRTCSEPRTGKVEKSIFSTVQVVLVSIDDAQVGYLDDFGIFLGGLIFGRNSCLPVILQLPIT